VEFDEFSKEVPEHVVFFDVKYSMQAYDLNRDAKILNHIIQNVLYLH